MERLIGTVSRGIRAPIIRSGDDIVKITVENVVNTVGAGDALCSSFVHYYAKGLKADEALMRAQIFASYKIGFDGASVGFATEVKVEELWENFC
jgi:sugar/nucleoside kinase (ribokinase family)